MTLDWLIAWQNLIYVLPFGTALLYLLLYAVSGVTFGDADADRDFSADAPGDVDGEIEVDHDVDAGDDAHSHGGHHVDHAGHHSDAAPETESSLFKTALTWLGVGRVPLSILLMVLLLSWGVTGFLVNQLVRARFGDGWQVVLVSLPIAAAVSLMVTGLVVRSIDRWLPLDETTARRRHDLLGLAGVAMYEITDHFGMLSLRDDRGELYQVPCRVERGQPPIAKNGRAVLVGYNANENLYRVMPAEVVGMNANTAKSA